MSTEWNHEKLVQHIQKFNVLGKELAKFLGVSEPVISSLRCGEKEFDSYSDKLTAFFNSKRAAKLAELQNLIQYYSGDI